MTVTVGFLGAGLIANFHARMLSMSHAGYTLGGVHDPDGGRAGAFAAEWGATAFSSEEEVLDASDAVYVCTWTSEHPRLVAAAAERGLDVFCEKPLATGLEHARAMTEAVEAAGVVNQVGLILRYSPAFSLARHLLTDPDAGEVMAMVFRDDQYLPVRGTYRSDWRGDRTKAGSGTLLEHSIHDLDLFEHTIGPVEQVSAWSAAHHGIDGIEDAVTCNARFAAGGLGTLVSVWHDVLERGSQRHVEIFCRNLYVEISSDWDGPVTWQRTGEESRSLGGRDLVSENKRRGIHRGNPDSAFIHAVATGRPAWPSFRHALRAHALVAAAYESASGHGSPVSVLPESLPPGP